MPTAEALPIQSAETQAVEAAIASLRGEYQSQGGRTRDALAATAPLMTVRFLDYASEMRRLYDELNRPGSTWAGPALRDMLASLVRLCEGRLGVIGQAEALLREWAVLDHDQAAGFGDAKQEIGRVRSLAADYLAWLGSPLPPIDPGHTEAVRAAYEQGDYEPVEDVVRRLEAGGTL